MQILNFGSLNIDYVYRVDSFVAPGETKSCQDLLINSGGKGLNQSIAAAKAGTTVAHAGIYGRDGGFLIEKLRENGVDVSLMQAAEGVNGHAIIQVDDTGQNCILLYGGTNQQLTEAYIKEALVNFGHEGLVLLQNETNLVGTIITQAHARGLQVAFNAAPFTAAVLDYPLDLLDWPIINEVEGRQIAGCDEVDQIIPRLREKYPNLSILLTLGKQGACCWHEGELTAVSSFNVKAVDTTAAGDTFIGYFLNGILNHQSTLDSLKIASAASALCVQRPGASDSIPTTQEVDQALATDSLGHLEILHD
jgi:ribokinase